MKLMPRRSEIISPITTGAAGVIGNERHHLFLCAKDGYLHE